MGFPQRIHDPDSRADYPFIWEPWLTDKNDTISTAMHHLFDAGTTTPTTDPITVDEEDNTTLGTVAWVTASDPDAVRGKAYDLCSRIDSVAGRREDRTMTLKCKEK